MTPRNIAIITALVIATFVAIAAAGYLLLAAKSSQYGYGKDDTYLIKDKFSLEEAPRGVSKVRFIYKGVTDDELRIFLKHRDLTELSLTNCQKISDHGIAPLVAHTRLRRLSLAGTAVSDYGLSVATELLHLHTLDVSDTNVSSANALTAFHEELEDLNVRGCRVDKEFVGTCIQLPNLRILNIAYCENLSASDISRLATCEKLVYLDLSGTRVTPTALRHILGLPNLEKITLYNLVDIDEAELDILRKSRPAVEWEIDEK